MSGAEYRVTQRLGESGVPLMVLTLKMEHEITLTRDQLQDFDNVLKKHSDGKDALEAEQVGAWLEVLQYIDGRFSEADGLAPWVQFEMRSDWRPLPFRYADKMLQEFSAAVKNGITTYTSGSFPNYEVNINWGSRTLRFPIKRGDMSTTLAELQTLQTAAQAIEDAKTEEAKQAAKTVYDGAIATGAVVGAARAIAAAAAEGAIAGAPGGGVGAVVGVIVGVTGAVLAIQGLFDAEAERREKQREAEERAMRADTQRGVHDAGVEYGRGLELGDRYRRTA